MGQPNLRLDGHPDDPWAAKAQHFAGGSQNDRDVEVTERRRHVLRGLIAGLQEIACAVMVMMVRTAQMPRMPRLVHPVHAIHLTDAHGPGSASGAGPEGQGDLSTTSASKRYVSASHASGLGTHDAVITVSDITVLAHITPMSNVAAASHRARAGHGAASIPAAPIAAARYEVAAAEMAAPKAATCEVPAAAARSTGMSATTAATTTCCVAPATSATSTRGGAGRAGARKRRSDEGRKAENGGECDEASTHGPVSRKTMLRELHAHMLNPGLRGDVNDSLMFVKVGLSLFLFLGQSTRHFVPPVA